MQPNIQFKVNVKCSSLADDFTTQGLVYLYLTGLSQLTDLTRREGEKSKAKKKQPELQGVTLLGTATCNVPSKVSNNCSEIPEHSVLF